MAEQEHGPTQHHQPDKAGGPTQLKGKNKTTWYIVGGLAVVAVLVFVFVRKSNANAAGGNTSTTPTTQLDPATMAALQSALQGQASGAFSGGGAIQGPAGPAGPAGPTGPTGETGATGATGPAGPPGTTGPAGSSGGWSGSSSGGSTGKTGGGAPHSPAPVPHPRPKPPPSHSKTYYTVKAGDNLSAIASHFRLPNWQTLYNANRSVVGGNPNLIYPGQRLLIP